MHMKAGSEKASPSVTIFVFSFFSLERVAKDNRFDVYDFTAYPDVQQVSYVNVITLIENS
jgi:hypothetical protein